MFDAVGHGMSVWAAQGEVQHHNLISGNEGRDTHDKDQVPEEDIRGDLCWTGG